MRARREAPATPLYAPCGMSNLRAAALLFLLSDCVVCFAMSELFLDSDMQTNFAIARMVRPCPLN